MHCTKISGYTLPPAIVVLTSIATEFLKGLLSNDITQRNGLNIIEVSCGPPWSKSTWSLYVRQAYVDLHAKIEATAKDVVIIGNPGIGKSYFALYELYLAVKANKMVVFYHQLTNATYVFDPMERKGFQDDFNTPCLLEAPVYLYDCGTKTPSTYPRTKSARMTMFSSPYRLNYIDALKTGALKLCMPVWSEVEVLNYGKYQYGDDELAENLSKFGGIPRYVFSEEHQKMEWLERLHLLCKSCTIETLDRLKGNRLDDEDSHMIFHLDSADDYKSYTIVFASYYVEGLVYTAIEEARKNGVVRFLNSAVAPMFASLQGHLFEWKAHEVLQEGGVFRTRCLDPPESEKRVTLATTSLEMFNKDTDIDWNAGSLYWRPKARNYPSLDAYMTPDIGFQMTVSGTHKIKAGGLKIIPANTNFKLYFVVPKRNFTCFKKQTIDTEGVAATIQQHALCLELKEY